MFRRHDQTAFKEALHQVDDELDQPCSVIMIGGAALCLAYRGLASADIDLWAPKHGRFWEAVARASQRHPDFIPIDCVAIATEPLHFEDRLVRLDLGFKYLQVLVPEPHDLVLFKTARATSHDLDAIEELSRHRPLSLATLIDRYHETKTQVIGPPSKFKLNFLAVVERLFGEDKALELDKTLDP